RGPRRPPGASGALTASPGAITSRTGRRPARKGSAVGRDLVDLGHQARLAPSGLVLVDDALGGGHVEALDRHAQAGIGVVRAALGGVDGGAGAGLELGADGLVPLVAHEVLLVALDLALDVRHGRLCSFRTNSRARLAAFRAVCHLLDPEGAP